MTDPEELTEEQIKFNDSVICLKQSEELPSLLLKGIVEKTIEVYIRGSDKSQKIEKWFKEIYCHYGSFATFDKSKILTAALMYEDKIFCIVNFDKDVNKAGTALLEPFHGTNFLIGDSNSRFLSENINSFILYAVNRIKEMVTDARLKTSLVISIEDSQEMDEDPPFNELAGDTQCPVCKSEDIFDGVCSNCLNSPVK